MFGTNNRHILMYCTCIRLLHSCSLRHWLRDGGDALQVSLGHPVALVRVDGLSLPVSMIVVSEW